MRNLVLIASLVAFVAVPAAVSLQADDDDAPKYTIKKVMTDGMKAGLHKKVISGDATDEEKKVLMEMAKSLKMYEPKKGTVESWNKHVDALIKASTAAVEGEDGAGDMLKAATNCKACHDAHKP